MKPETLLISTYPRDDVRWPNDGLQRRGLVEVLSDQSGVIESLSLGDFNVLSPDLAVGATFTVRVTAGDGRNNYEQSFRFTVTGDEDDVGQYALGPGLEVERGRFGRKTFHGFEFGAIVMGAVPGEPDGSA